MEMTFPGREWARVSPGDVGLDPQKIDELGSRVITAADGAPFRWVVTRFGYMGAEWGQGIETDRRINQSSSGKSYYSSVLGIAVDEGVIAGLDARAVDYYPERAQRRVVTHSQRIGTSRSGSSSATRRAT